jgi:hypothetical protein
LRSTGIFEAQKVGLLQNRQLALSSWLYLALAFAYDVTKIQMEKKKSFTQILACYHKAFQRAGSVCPDSLVGTTEGVAVL